jgi:uncharacterized membrane protein (UPF0136 family)
MDLSFLLGVLMRWIHVGSAVALLGGIFCACNLARTGKLKDGPAAGFSPAVAVILILLVGAGLYNFLTKPSPLPHYYHMVFGIKVLLAMHIIAVALIMGRPGASPDKVKRWLTGMSISGLVVLLLSAVLRALTMAAAK